MYDSTPSLVLPFFMALGEIIAKGRVTPSSVSMG